MREDIGLEVVPDRHGLLVADHYAGRTPEVVQGQSLNSRVFLDEPQLDVNANTSKGRRKIILKTRTIIGLVILTLAIILGGVLGGILGSRANHKSPLGDANGTSTSTVMGPEITSTSLPPKVPTIHNKTNIAAIGWDYDNLLHHRVYYQSAINEIYEGAWNSSSGSWYILSKHGLAKNGTPISAVAAWRYGGIIVNLYFLDESGKVKELVSLDGLRWEAGSLTTKNIIPAPSSKLACARASNQEGGPESLLFVFQDDQNTFRLYNSTSNVWVDSKIPANPINASGVSLLKLTTKEYPDQLRLYYQTAPGNLVAAEWISLAQLQAANVTSKYPGWNLNEDTLLSNFEMEAQLTSLAWENNRIAVDVYGKVTNFPVFVCILTSGSKSLAVVNWFPSDTSTYEPPDIPPVMKNVGNYSAVASDFWGNTYVFNDSGMVVFTYKVDRDKQTVSWTDQLITP